MSKIVINLKTDEKEDISIDMKMECTLNELEIATGHLMGVLAIQSSTGMKVLESLMEDLKDVGTSDTEEDNKVPGE